MKYINMVATILDSEHKKPYHSKLSHSIITNSLISQVCQSTKRKYTHFRDKSVNPYYANFYKILQQGWQFPTKKLIRGKQNGQNNWFVPAEFRLFRGTGNSRNSVPNHSLADTKCLEFCTVGQKQKQTLGIAEALSPQIPEQISRQSATIAEGGQT